MSSVFGVRHETKSPWEKRTPLTPQLVRHLVKDRGFEVLVQSSSRRIFDDKEYLRAGASVAAGISAAPLVLGVKEIPAEKLTPDTTYAFFSHVIKGQEENMPMLARLMELGCTLIDYERITDDDGRRLVFFGRFAGLAGMIEALWALGQRLQWEGIANPFTLIDNAHTYADLDDAQAAVRAAGEAIGSEGLPPELAPLIVGVAGYGNVAAGVNEILSELPTREITPEEVAGLRADPEPSRNCLYRVTFREQHLVKPCLPEQAFELQEYYQHPQRYEPCFKPFLDHLTVLMNCNYWEESYPRLVSLAALRDLYAGEQPALRVIGDLGCDLDGNVECTVRATEPGDPVYVYNPSIGEAISGVAGHGPVVLAVDILPSELPADASNAFSEALKPLLPAIAKADFSVPYAELDLPAEILRAVIVHRGKLTPDYVYLEENLQGLLPES